MTYLVDPRDEDHRDKLPFATFNGDLEFKIKPDGKLTIKPGKNAVADLLAPIIHLNGRQENIVDPKSPAVGSVGSPEMMRHIEKITGAKIHSNNRTELLVDGIQSFPKRLELLKRAKEILSTLESSRTSYNINSKKDQYQLSFIKLDDPIIDEIKTELGSIDIDNLTPIEALMKLHDIKRKIGLDK